MAIKKSDLYSSLWASCDELRGGMDASQYKDYVLFMLFIKYVSDKYGASDDFAPPVTIPMGASFKDMVALKGKSDIGDKINTQVIQPLIDANARLKEIGRDPDYTEERQALEDYAALLDQQADAKARLKTAQDDLEAKLDAKYPKRTESDIQTLVVDDKWLTTLAAAVQGELDRVSQTLTGRIRQLAERYTTPLPQLVEEVEQLSARVGKHLKKMGFA